MQLPISLVFLGVWFSHKIGLKLDVKLSLAVMFLPLSLLTVIFLINKYLKNKSENIEIKDYFLLMKRGRGFSFCSFICSGVAS
nr:hypothetical protein KXZ65_20045 [Pectobacterium sp. PL152]